MEEKTGDNSAKKKICWVCGRDEKKLKEGLPQLQFFDFKNYWFNYNPKVLEDFMETSKSRKKGYFKSLNEIYSNVDICMVCHTLLGCMPGSLRNNK